MANIPNFHRMWEEYPHGSAAEAKAAIGGNVDADWITNTCTVRLSRCFNYAGHRIPNNAAGLVTTRGGDGLRYAFRVREFKRWMDRRYGRAPLQQTFSGGGSVPDSFKGVRGVICFEVDGWDDATGHFDLWNGEKCAHGEYFSKASAVYLWPEPQGRTLTASVGRGGRNFQPDVQLVQELLLGLNYDVGPVDGLMGSRTIAAIRDFQRSFGGTVDGRIDVGGSTWRKLSG